MNECCKENIKSLIEKIESMYTVTDVKETRPIKKEETYIRIMNPLWEKIKKEYKEVYA